MLKHELLALSPIFYLHHNFIISKNGDGGSGKYLIMKMHHLKFKFGPPLLDTKNRKGTYKMCTMYTYWLCDVRYKARLG